MEFYKELYITDLKDMLNKTDALYGNKPAYKIRIKNNDYKIYSHNEVRSNINFLGTALIDLGLKNKKIGVIGGNSFEWELAYLSVVCGTGIVVPIDKSLPNNELKKVIQRSEIEAIFCTSKYENVVSELINNKVGKLKFFISMDNDDSEYAESKLIEHGKQLVLKGDKSFVSAKINADETSIILFTSGTTSASKVVCLSHKNICSNLMSLSKILNVDSSDRFLSFLPLHHVFECTVGFLFPLYMGAQISFCDGIRHILENFREYNITFVAFVPAIYENIYRNIIRKYEKENKLKELEKLILENKNSSMDEKKEIFKDIHNMFGGNVKMLISGAAAIDPKVQEGYRNFGINLCQGYGLTETSPVIGIETILNHKSGSIGKCIPDVEARLVNVNEEGIGELVVKGPNVMLGYYENEEANKNSLKDGWFYTGDLASIDDEGYIFIKGRKKSVIVLKNGKNIFPEEMEALINRIDGVKESYVFGKPVSRDKDDLKIYAKIVYDKNYFDSFYTGKEVYNIIGEKVKAINKTMPLYKYIRDIIITENELIKTTTSKIKRNEEYETVCHTNCSIIKK